MPSSRSLAPIACLAAALACGDDPRVEPPAAEFLVAAGDSTVWVRAGDDGLRARGSAILLAELDGRFHEVYVADDDRSYFSAVFIGQRVYRRDLITGDSAVVFQDSVIPGLARSFGMQHPAEPRLSPDEEGSESPRTSATVELEVLALLGPYLSVAQYSDVHLEQGDEYHTTRHRVIDLRDGAPATIARLFGKEAADSIVARGRLAFSAALDSILAAGDSRAARAAESIAGLEFDATSWALHENNGAPVVVFLVPGRGDVADGLALALSPIRAPVVAWWHRDVTPLLPTVRTDSMDGWTRDAYSVIARYESAGGRTRLALRDTAAREWQVSSLAGPIRRIHWLDHPPIDSLTRHGLARAFDESMFYSEEARSVRHERRRDEAAALVRVGLDRRTRPPQRHRTFIHRTTHAR